MPNIELKILIGSLIAIDIVIVVVFIYLVNKLKYFRKSETLEKEIGLFESLISDSEKIADQFRSQLETKNLLIKGLNAKLEEKISALNLLLNRADALLSSYRDENKILDLARSNTDNHRTAVVSLAREGYRAEEISEKLSLPKSEVKLLLDLHEEFKKLQDEDDVPL